MVQFTDTLSSDAAGLVAQPAQPVADPVDTSFQSLAGVAKSFMPSPATQAAANKARVEAMIGAEVNEAFKEDARQLQTQLQQGAEAERQGGIASVARIARERQVVQRLQSKYGGKYSTTLATIVEAQLGYDPREELRQIEERDEAFQFEQSVAFERATTEALTSGLIKPKLDEETGGIDRAQATADLLELNTLLADTNLATSKRENFTANHKLTIDNYTSKVATNFLSLNDPANPASQVYGPTQRDHKLFTILTKAHNNETITAAEELYANQSLDVYVNGLSNKVRQQLPGLSGENSAYVKTSLDSKLAGGLRGYISAASQSAKAGGDRQALLNAEVSNLETGETLRIYNAVPSTLTDKALVETYGAELFLHVTSEGSGAEIIEGFKNNIDTAKLIIATAGKAATSTPADYTDKEIKETAKVNKVIVKGLQATRTEYVTPDQARSDGIIYNNLFTAGASNVESSLDVVTTLASDAGVKQFQLLSENLTNPDVRNAVVSSGGQMIANLRGLVGSKELGESVVLSQDPGSKAFFLRTPELTPELIDRYANPLSKTETARRTSAMDALETAFRAEIIENDLNEWVTSVNGYVFMSGTMQGLTGTQVASLDSFLKTAPTAVVDPNSLVAPSARDLDRVTMNFDGGYFTYTPDNELHNYLLRAEKPKGVSGGGLMGGLSSALAEGANATLSNLPSLDPVGDVISQTGNDEVGNLIGNLEDDVEIIDKVIAREGGFVNDPTDRGGATNFGITQKTLKAFRGEKVTTEDVKNLTKDEAAQIYKANFLTEPKIDQLPANIQEFVFDFAVNSGPSTAIKQLQKAAGVKADGKIGPQTIAAAQNVGIKELAAKRIEFLTRIVQNDPSQAKFLTGWINRVVEFLG